MNEPIRILHVLTAMDMAGTETLLMNIYRNIDRDKVQFDFAVSTSAECAYDREICDMGGKIIHYPRYRGVNHFAYKKWWREFLVSHPEYRIVHGHIGSTAAIYLGIAKKLGRYTIAHSHSTASTVSLHSVLYGIYAYPTRFIANQFFGCSKQALIDRYGKVVANDSSRARVINNAIDAKKFVYNEDIRKNIRDEYGIKSDEMILATVGRLTKQKNPYEIIRICAMLKSRGLEFKFLWFGMGELEKELKQEVKEKKLEDAILFMGNRSDIHNVLQAADIFLFPSIWEGLGIACVEAQAAGLVTFCSDTVPVEAKVTSLCRYLPLDDTKLWCESIEESVMIIRSQGYKRPDTYKDVVKSGFDIVEVAGWLQEYYLNRVEE